MEVPFLSKKLEVFDNVYFTIFSRKEDRTNMEVKTIFLGSNNRCFWK